MVKFYSTLQHIEKIPLIRLVYTHIFSPEMLERPNRQLCEVCSWPKWKRASLSMSPLQGCEQVRYEWMNGYSLLASIACHRAELQ